MLLIDLVLQGIKRFVQSQKIPFKPGFNLIYGGNESGKTTLYTCLLEMLFPAHREKAPEFWKSWQSSEHCRAGLTLKEGDYLYRILSDFNQNKVSLSRKSLDAERFERLSTNPEEIEAILSEELNLPDYESFKAIFTDSWSGLPSLTGWKKSTSSAQPAEGAGEQIASYGYQMSQPGFGYPQMPQMPGMPMPSGMGAPGYMSGPGIAPMPGMGMPGMPGMGMPGAELLEEDDGLSWEDKEKRLEELKQELERVKEMEDIQFELDGYQGKLFELEKEKEKVKKIDQQIEKLDKELEKYKFFRNLPENIDQRIAQYDSLQANRGKDIDAIDQKLADLEDELRFLEAQPKFYQKGLFKGGVALLVLGILGLVLPGIIGIKALQNLGLLLIPALVMIFIVFWKFFSEQTKMADLRDKIAQLEEQRKNTLRDYEVKGAIVKKLLEQTKCDNTEELKEMLDTYRNLEAQKLELTKKKKELMIELDWDKLNEQERELKLKIKELEEKLKGFAGLGMDPNELRREIERLENSLERARKLGLISGGKEQPEQEAQPASLEQIITASFWDILLEKGGGIFGLGAEQIYEKIKPRINLYLQAFSSNRYQEVRKEGEDLLVLVRELEQEVSVNQLAGTALDLIYFSLKFALLEIIMQKYQLPLIFDEPFQLMDQSRKTALAKSLKRFAGKSQVILFSSDKIFSQVADQALSLGA